MNIKSRVEKLEAVRGSDDHASLEQIIMYSYCYLTDPDPELSARIERSVLGRLIAATVAAYEARLALSGVVS